MLRFMQVSSVSKKGLQLQHEMQSRRWREQTFLSTSEKHAAHLPLSLILMHCIALQYDVKLCLQLHRIILSAARAMTTDHSTFCSRGSLVTASAISPHASCLRVLVAP